MEDFRAKLDEVTLTVAECGEFHNLGEFHENIPTVDEAIAIWKQIPPERMYGIPAIGINIHTPGTKKIDDVGSDVLCGKHFDLEILEYIPEIKNSPQAMEVIAGAYGETAGNGEIRRNVTGNGVKGMGIAYA